MATANAMFTITDVGDLNGRNLIRRSFFTKEPWTGPKNVVSDGFGVYHDKECLPVYTSYILENTNSGTETAYPDLVFEENTQYTISGKWAQFRTDSKFNVLWIIFRYSDGTSTSIKQPTVNNEWRDFKLTSEAGKTVVAITHTYWNSGYTFLADYKLEVGTEATEWTPAPEDVNNTYISAKTANETADYAKSEIDGLEVGGRNLILNGDEEHSRTVPSAGSTVYISNYNFSAYGIPYAHTEGEEMTVSFNFEATGNELDTGRIYLQLMNTAISSSNISHYLIDAPSGKYVRTFKVTAAQAAHSGNHVRVPVIGCSPGTVVKVWNMKVELGNRATDWTPAPEDVEEAINSKNSVYYQATAPTGNLKDGDTWFDTSNHYKISRWNVAEQNWIAAPLGDQAVGNLNASHINSGTLTAVDIEAGKAQDIAGTIKVYDENDAVKVGLDKDGLVATKGKIGGWNITSNSIEYDDGTAPTDGTVVTDPDTGEELIEEGQPGLVGGRTILKLCTYDSSYPNAGPQLISATYNSSNVAEDSTLRIGSGGLSCDYNRNNGVTGGSLSLSPKLINIINADYDEDQVLWTDSANLNPGSLTILMSKKENGEQTVMGRSFLTHGDLSFIGDDDNPQLASGIAHWSILSPERTVKDTLKVTVYHCGNLFWAHFTGTIPAGWTASNTQNVFVPIITGDTGLSNSAFAAPPDNLTKYIIPTNLTNMRISVTVRPDGQLGISKIAEPFKGNATTTIAGYMETCDIFWAHIG